MGVDVEGPCIYNETLLNLTLEYRTEMSQKTKSMVHRFRPTYGSVVVVGPHTFGLPMRLKSLSQIISNRRRGETSLELKYEIV